MQTDIIEKKMGNVSLKKIAVSSIYIFFRQYPQTIFFFINVSTSVLSIMKNSIITWICYLKLQMSSIVVSMDIILHVSIHAQKELRALHRV